MPKEIGFTCLIKNGGIREASINGTLTKLSTRLLQCDAFYIDEKQMIRLFPNEEGPDYRGDWYVTNSFGNHKGAEKSFFKTCINAYLKTSTQAQIDSEAGMLLPQCYFAVGSVVGSSFTDVYDYELRIEVQRDDGSGQGTGEFVKSGTIKITQKDFIDAGDMDLIYTTEYLNHPATRTIVTTTPNPAPVAPPTEAPAPPPVASAIPVKATTPASTPPAPAPIPSPSSPVAVTKPLGNPETTSRLISNISINCVGSNAIGSSDVSCKTEIDLQNILVYNLIWQVSINGSSFSSFESCSRSKSCDWRGLQPGTYSVRLEFDQQGSAPIYSNVYDAYIPAPNLVSASASPIQLNSCLTTIGSTLSAKPEAICYASINPNLVIGGLNAGYWMVERIDIASYQEEYVPCDGMVTCNFLNGVRGGVYRVYGVVLDSNKLRVKTTSVMTVALPK